MRPISKEERAAIESEVKTWQGVAGRRRKIAKEMWDMIKDTIPEGTDLEEMKECLSSMFFRWAIAYLTKTS